MTANARIRTLLLACICGAASLIPTADTAAEGVPVGTYLYAQDASLAGFSGSLVIAEFDSLNDAEQWLAADPYVEAGVFVRTSARPYKKVLP